RVELVFGRPVRRPPDADPPGPLLLVRVELVAVEHQKRSGDTAVAVLQEPFVRDDRRTLDALARDAPRQWHELEGIFLVLLVETRERDLPVHQLEQFAAVGVAPVDRPELAD